MKSNMWDHVSVGGIHWRSTEKTKVGNKFWVDGAHLEVVEVKQISENIQMLCVKLIGGVMTDELKERLGVALQQETPEKPSGIQCSMDYFAEVESKARAAAEQRLHEIKARFVQSTPGPWKYINKSNEEFQKNDLGHFSSIDATKVMDFGDDTRYYPSEGQPPEPQDIALIENLHADMAWLISEVERLKQLHDIRDNILHNGLMD